jgi:hypothetical protein
VRLGRLQERPQLVGGPQSADLATDRTGALGALGRVGREQALDVYGVVQRLAPGAVHVRHGAGRERTPAAATLLTEQPAQAADGGRAQRLQAELPDVRQHVVLDVLPVALRGGRLDRDRVAVEPREQVLADGDVVPVDVRAGPCSGACLVARLPGSAARREPPTHFGRVRPVAGSGTRTT